MELLLKPTCVKMLVLIQSHVSLATEVIIHNLLSSSHFISELINVKMNGNEIWY